MSLPKANEANGFIASVAVGPAVLASTLTSVLISCSALGSKEFSPSTYATSWLSAGGAASDFAVIGGCAGFS